MRKLLTPTIFVLLFALLACPAPSSAQIAVGVAIHIGPPALPVYTQPPCPTEGYLWTPGYWAYGPAGYYWVPGVWVAPPQVGFLWTPGYWGFAGGIYGWHGGYWGPHVGFYGGLNYGFGYGGVGFVGGHWGGGGFIYNSAVLNVGVGFHNTYVDRTVINNTTIVNNHVSFNGPGGVAARPTPQEQAYEHENHVQPTANQLAHEHTASQDRSQLASTNGGHPGTMAMDSVNGHRFNQQGHAANSEVGARAENQQQRIANGVHNGQMSPSQAAKVEGHEANINHQIATDRRANGGKLTPVEKKNINQKQNNASRQIYNDKHDGKNPPKK